MMKRSFFTLFAGAWLLLAACAHVPEDPGPLTPFEAGNFLGYRNARGETVLEPRYIVAGPFNAHGIAAVVDEKGWAYIDRKGSVVIRPYVIDNGPDDFKGGLARFRSGSKFGFFNERGEISIQAKFDFAGPFQEGRAPFCKGCREKKEGEYSWFSGGTWGFIDRQGTPVIPAAFEEVEAFHKGKARVREGGKWFFIDPAGKKVP
jgi:hypothetical protein